MQLGIKRSTWFKWLTSLIMDFEVILKISELKVTRLESHLLLWVIILYKFLNCEVLDAI